MVCCAWSSAGARSSATLALTLPISNHIPNLMVIDHIAAIPALDSLLSSI